MGPAVRKVAKLSSLTSTVLGFRDGIRHSNGSAPVCFVIKRRNVDTLFSSTKMQFRGYPCGILSQLAELQGQLLGRTDTEGECPRDGDHHVRALDHALSFTPGSSRDHREAQLKQPFLPVGSGTEKRLAENDRSRAQWVHWENLS